MTTLDEIKDTLRLRLTGQALSFAKALNRSVTGSMNDLVNHAKHWLVEDDLALHDVGFRLNDILLSALARSKTDFYWKPRQAFKQLTDRCSMEGK